MIRSPRHQAIERVDLADEMPLPQPAKSRVARHGTDHVQTERDEGNAAASTRCRSCGLAAGMTAADHYNVKIPMFHVELFPDAEA
ncbi:hypothetical protein GGR88_002464 [Sphingomonas jejuensis]|uniref:Uncharacterized protein n=1 Tax=Sphingomonas jejuensis TaxID=904715 RepID=A0ABX0XNZ1_9SPHN|nr:hypothetical protein [Sphingomonas jejuensis]